MTASACIDAETLAEMFARGMSASSRDAVERHVDTCSACRALVAAYARASDDSADDPTALDLTPDAFAPTISSAAPVAAAHAQVGQLVGGRYLLEHVVGEGGMGVVWAARDLVGDRKVALKILKEASPELAGRSWREARASAYVGSPSLVEVLDVVPPRHEGEAPVLVMPLLEGESLERLLARRTTLGAREALLLLEPVVGGMVAAHAKGIIHRDLKPANVFLADDGTGRGPTPVVLDFGLAKILSPDGTDAGADKLTRTGALVGTPHYMAPEQLFGDASVDDRADVWALGVILYECLAGKRPVEGRSYGQIARNVARGRIAPLVEAAPGVDPAVAALVDRMLAKEPPARPALADVLVTVRALLDRVT